MILLFQWGRTSVLWSNLLVNLWLPCLLHCMRICVCNYWVKVLCIVSYFGVDFVGAFGFFFLLFFFKQEAECMCAGNTCFSYTYLGSRLQSFLRLPSLLFLKLLTLLLWKVVIGGSRHSSWEMVVGGGTVASLLWCPCPSIRRGGLGNCLAGLPLFIWQQIPNNNNNNRLTVS